ncbi:MAG TPA: hypothetical protein VFZ91_05615 [Allosphingosinicella sp.]
MARSPSIFALALLAMPAALPAEPGAMPQIDPARVIEAAEACRQAPLDYQPALRHLREQGFGDLPPEVRGRMPYTTLTRQDVRLILIPTTFIPGSCKVYGEVSEASRFADVVAQLTSAFGGAPVTSEADRADWWLDDRTIHASLAAGTLSINVIFHRVARAEMIAGPRPARPAPATAPEPQIAMRPASPADEIAAAASACMASLGKKGIDPAAMTRAGWPLAEMLGEAHIHTRDGSNVRVVTTAMGGGQCIVDAYGERGDSFDAIRDAIGARLRARFGAQAKLGSATGDTGAFSRGQGFLVGKRIGILSSEQRADGLSIRFTAMSIR